MKLEIGDKVKKVDIGEDGIIEYHGWYCDPEELIKIGEGEKVEYVPYERRII